MHQTRSVAYNIFPKQQVEDKLTSVMNRLIKEGERFDKFKSSGNNVDSFTIVW